MVWPARSSIRASVSMKSNRSCAASMRPTLDLPVPIKPIRAMFWKVRTGRFTFQSLVSTFYFGMTILEEILQPLQALSKSSDFLQSRTLGQVGGLELPSYLLHGPRGGGDAVRIGLFAGIHGDEPAGPVALSRVAERLSAEPMRAE